MLNYKLLNYKVQVSKHFCPYNDVHMINGVFVILRDEETEA